MAAVETDDATVYQTKYAQEKKREKCSAFLYTIGQAGRDVYNKSSQYVAETSAEVFGLKQKRNSCFYNTQTRAPWKPSEEPTPQKRTCGNCGLRHPRKQCPAYGKQCLKCNKPNHFAEVFFLVKLML